MATKRLSEAKYVARGYGQVEPQHLSAKFTGQIYAQLPADPSIEVLENGMFAKYDYAHGVVTFGTSTVAGDSADAGESQGEWMLVLNEVNLYREYETFEDFAMIRENFNTRVYSPIAQHDSTINQVMDYTGEVTKLYTGEGAYTTGVPNFTYGQAMPVGSTMTPRLLKTNVGDIFTTNCVDEEIGDVAVGDILAPKAGTGYLCKAGDTASMKWQVTKVYTLANNMPAVKLQRIA